MFSVSREKKDNNIRCMNSNNNKQKLSPNFMWKYYLREWPAEFNRACKSALLSNYANILLHPKQLSIKIAQKHKVFLEWTDDPTKPS